MLIRIPNKYTESNAINQSYLKALVTGIGTFKKEQEKYFDEQKHFLYGSALDSLIYDTEEDFYSKFFVSITGDKPSDTLISISHRLYDSPTRSTHDLDKLDQEIWMAMNTEGYYLNRKNDNYREDTRIAGVKEKIKDYWGFLMKAAGKQILSIEDYQLILSMKNSLTNHPFTKKYFDFSQEGVYVIPQFAIYFDYRGHQCRALLDQVIIDTNNYTIQPIDLKTIGDNTKSFPRNVIRNKYLIQAAWYTRALGTLIDIQTNSLVIQGLQTYKILPFKFIVESTTSPGICPLVYTCSEKDLMIGKWGAVKTNNGYEIGIDYPIEQKTVLGYEDGLTLHEQHVEANQWDYDMNIFNNNGDLILDIYG